MTPQSFDRDVRLDLRQRRWLRLHASLIGASTLAIAWLTSHGLMLAHVDRLSVRYGIAFALAYLAQVGLLYLWSRWLLSRDDGNIDAQFDAQGGTGGGGSSHDSPTCSIESGQGGDFGGGGASSSFDALDATGADGLANSAGDAVGSAAEALGAADEGIVVLVPLALVLLVAGAIGTVLSFAVFGLFGVEVLLAVAVEIAFASIGGALAYKARREGWLRVALRRTARPAAVALCAVVVVGALVDHWVPSARSLPHAVKLLRV